MHGFTVIQKFLKAEICNGFKIHLHCVPYLRDHSPTLLIFNYVKYICFLYIFLIVYNRKGNTGPIDSLSESEFSKINFAKCSMGVIHYEVRVLLFKMHYVLEMKSYYLLPCSPTGRMPVF